ncbi:MAG: hypothetical protein R3D30_08935 [Hyphomicrobiales bacterium]
MRLVFLAAFVAMSFIPYGMVVVPAQAAPGCSCQGCGCKGGPGWRGPEGTCVAKAKLASICGEPAGAPCTLEAAAQVCFVTPFGAEPERTETQ